MSEDSKWYQIGPRSSTCALTGCFWLLSHVIYLKLTRVSSFPSFNFWMINYSYTQKNNWVSQNCSHAVMAFIACWHVLYASISANFTNKVGVERVIDSGWPHAFLPVRLFPSPLGAEVAGPCHVLRDRKRSSTLPITYFGKEETNSTFVSLR